MGFVRELLGKRTFRLVFMIIESVKDCLCPKDFCQLTKSISLIEKLQGFECVILQNGR
jgi:hypothetical protein